MDYYLDDAGGVFLIEDQKEIKKRADLVARLTAEAPLGSCQNFSWLTPPRSFNFDAAKRLFEEEPERAERLRSELIEAFIAAHPESAEKLRQLQWRIDQVRAHYKDSPLGSCVVVNRMLMEQMYAKGGFIYAVNALFIGFVDQKEACALLEKEKTEGHLLSFKRT